LICYWSPDGIITTGKVRLKNINIEDKTATEQLKPTKELDENDKKK
jgi:hypothetical protein